MQSPQHFDVLIIGAGLSGIGLATHLQANCPNKSYAILEGRNSIGGTWDIHRYPGMRSDSDMYTLGYSFKPWTHKKSIADGATINAYIKEAAKENNIEKHIRFAHQTIAANYSSADQQWTITCKVGEADTTTYTCQFLFGCTGYYNYAGGYIPEYPDRNKFKGTFIHPQHWPENLDYTGKKVVVIGSGATAVTLIPAMAGKAAHVTMLQRSPSYVATLPLEDKISAKLRKVLPETTVYRLARARQVAFQMSSWNLARKQPKLFRSLLLKMTAKQLGPNFDMAHFTPVYNPWDERLCAVPDGDLFKVLKSGQATVVTDHIARFTANGIELKSGKTLEADIIVSATGLNMQMLGGINITKDQQPIEVSKVMNYKGVMFENVPNFAMIFGYTNSSWTLKSDITSEYLCRLINHMDKNGIKQCTPINRDPSVSPEPMLNMRSGYIQRSKDQLPLQGNKAPWKLTQNYLIDLAALRYGDIADGIMDFRK